MITYEYFVSLAVSTNKGIFFLDLPYLCGKEILEFSDIQVMKKKLLQEIKDNRELKFNIQLISIINFKLLNSRIINKSTGSED